MVSRRNMHAYDPSETERLKGVPIPPKIKCGRCHKSYPPAKYSAKQLTDLRYQISQRIQKLKPINCQRCTGGNQIVEIECTMCHKTKGLECFAKSQRSNSDTAKCFKCTEIQVTHEPVDHDKYEDQTQTFVTPDTSAGRVPEYWADSNSTMGSSADDHDWKTVNGDADGRVATGGVALSEHFQRTLSINRSVPETLIDSEYAFPAFGNGNGTGDRRSENSWHTGTATTGANLNRYGNPSATSHTGTQHTYGSSVAERSEAGGVRPNGWPRIPLGPARSPFVRPAGDSRCEMEGAWAESDGDDSEEEDRGDSDESDGDDTVI